MKLTMPFSSFEVSGNSMLPTFQSGDTVIVWRWGRIKEGDTIVFYKNGMMMVKRAAEKKGERWMVRADNVGEGSDSLDFGEVPKENIIGKVIAAY